VYQAEETVWNHCPRWDELRRLKVALTAGSTTANFRPTVWRQLTVGHLQMGVDLLTVGTFRLTVLRFLPTAGTFLPTASKSLRRLLLGLRRLQIHRPGHRGQKLCLLNSQARTNTTS